MDVHTLSVLLDPLKRLNHLIELRDSEVITNSTLMNLLFILSQLPRKVLMPSTIIGLSLMIQSEIQVFTSTTRYLLDPQVVLTQIFISQ